MRVPWPGGVIINREIHQYRLKDEFCAAITGFTVIAVQHRLLPAMFACFSLDLARFERTCSLHVAMAAFTLRSTLKSRDLDAKIQATGTTTSGLKDVMIRVIPSQE
jgi:hypothetical protein